MPDRRHLDLELELELFATSRFATLAHSAPWRPDFALVNPLGNAQ